MRVRAYLQREGGGEVHPKKGFMLDPVAGIQERGKIFYAAEKSILFKLVLCFLNTMIVHKEL